ncbi:formate dehydrogenase subunit gamma [Siccirubricoccus sp. G192]|uniref:formate dehydrogenase subunit gamma n=1 Tax=Siccirubricoccus sp. G192 TaxID=2849651 RepID=UPI001C2CA219|nr:formate dehydrogenase subunit gamma [Siccirubricoccus sp. G192]MBV1797169.1 formate dehydrogenase subunit gamma [Siccirubricoccus sp. G192]
MMRRILPLALLLLAAPATAQDRSPGLSGNLPAGAPEVQAPVPEVGDGRGGQPAGQPPATTEQAPPTGAPAPAVAPVAPAAQPARPAPATDALRGEISAEELGLQRALQGGRIEGRITIPDRQAASLIQPEGREWRVFHNRTLAWTGGIAVLGMLGVLALFYLVRGRIRIESGWSGRSLLRFDLLERANHWMVASSFIVLALSGLNLTFGRYLLLPLIGPEAFTALSHYGKLAHNFLAFPFTLGLVVMLLLWVRDNLPNRIDLAWLRAGGGFLGRGHPAAERFNAGQKLVFWITVLGGGLVAASGFVLLFPFAVTDIGGMQWAQRIHGILSVLMIAAMLGHIYIGTLGTEGAYEAMGSGRVDYNYAKEHHSLWVDEELAKARETVAPPGGARVAGAD